MGIARTGLSALIVTLAVSFMTTACSHGVDSDYRERAWERFTVNGERALSDQRYDIAASAFDSAVDQSRQSGDNSVRLAESLSNVGWALMKAGKTTRATSVLQECDHLCDQLLAHPDNTGLALSLVRVRVQTTLAECERISGHPDQALPHFRKALEIFQQSKFPSDYGYGAIGEVVTVAYSGLGDSLMATNKPIEALDAYRLAAETSDITPGRLSLKDAAREKYVLMLQKLKPELSNKLR